MKIWIVNQYAVPPTQAGITRHHDLARALMQRGHQVLIIASSFDHVTRRETRLAPGVEACRETIGGVDYLWLRTPSYRGNSLARVRNMLVFAARVGFAVTGRVAEVPDVIVGSSPHLFGALAAERLAHRLRVPFVLEVRDLWPQSLVDLGNMAPGHAMVRTLEVIERHLYRRAAGIVSVLPQAADHMIARGARADRLIWLPNGVDLRLVPRPRPAPPSDRLRLLYAGSHGLANGLDSLIEAARHLESDGFGDRVELCFMGDGPEKPRLQAEAADLRSVRFANPVPKQDVYRVLQGADGFIATMRDVKLYRHGISFNKLYDYMALARPTVLGTTGSATPISEAGAGILVPAENGPAIADGIRRLALMSPEARWEMGLRGRAYVEGHCDLMANVERLEALLQLTVHGPSAGGEPWAVSRSA